MSESSLPTLSFSDVNQILQTEVGTKRVAKPSTGWLTAGLTSGLERHKAASTPVALKAIGVEATYSPLPKLTSSDIDRILKD